MPVKRLLLASAALLLLPATLAAAPRAPASQAAAPAPAQSSWMRGEGLRADPELRIGTLPNGMRFVIRRNRTPPGEAALRLHVDTGSLNEADDQRGLAHFLEHMVLNGTENVPEGDFVKRLERQGLRFGPDTNASTSFGQTVFQLDLPETDADTLQEGIFLLREVAGRATISDSAVERERGIILSEERARATPTFRQFSDEIAWLFPGQLLPNRLPIGTVEVIRSAPRQRLVDFYRAWYRPENTTLVAVGDFDPQALEALVARQFGDWRGVGPAGVPAAEGTPAPRATVASVFVDPAIAAGVRMAWVRPASGEPDSVALRRRNLAERIAMAVLNRRLEKLAQDDAPPFVNAAINNSELENTAETTQIGATARLGDWRSALRAIEREQRRLVTHGITADEYEREILVSRTSLESGVASATTRTSASLAAAIISAVDDGTVVTTPADRLAFFEAAVMELNPARVHAAARRLFEGSGPLLYLTLPRASADRTALLSTYQASRAIAVTPPAARPRIAWPYGSFGTPGTVAERREFAEIGTTHVRFENGVRLSVRPSQNRRDQIFVSVRFGDGRLAIDPTRLSPEWALGAGFIQGGTSRLDIDEISRAISGRVVSANFGVEDENFLLTGGSRPADLPLQMELLAATLTDPAWRPTGWERIKATANQIHDRLESTPSGIFTRESGLLLRSGDRRWELPGRSAMRASTIADGRALLDPALRSGEIEVIIVGDVTVEQAIAETARTFGALAPRPQRRATPGPMRFPAGSAEPVTLFHKGRADQGLGFIAWPTLGYRAETRQLARTLGVLGAVFQLRITDRLREAEGASYSPNASHGASPTWDYGFLSAAMEAPPAKLDGFFAAATEIAADLVARPVSADELNRALRPTLESIERARDGNAFWLGALGDLGEDPLTLQSIATQESDLRAVTPAMLQDAARRFLLPAAAKRIRVVPGTPAQPSPPPRR